MRKQIILHAGMPKTGTTTIQNAFHAERKRILEIDGMLYPSISENHTNAMCTIFMENPKNHISNRMSGVQDETELKKLQKKYLKSIEKELDEVNWKLLLISAEGISNLSKPELSNFLDWARKYTDDIKVMFWVREPVSFTISVMQQIIKGGVLLEDLYKNPPIPNWKGKIGNSIMVFGRDNIILRDFETAKKHQLGIVGSFAENLGLSEESKSIVAGAAEFDNESMSIESVKLFNQLNRSIPMFVDGRRNPRRFNGELSIFQRIKGNRFDVPIEVRRKCINLTRPDVNWINKTFNINLYSDTEEVDELNIESKKMWSDRAVNTTAILIHDLALRVSVLQQISDAQLLYREDNKQMAKKIIEKLKTIDSDVILPGYLDELTD